jgi:hypothetical protein
LGNVERNPLFFRNIPYSVHNLEGRVHTDFSFDFPGQFPIPESNPPLRNPTDIAAKDQPERIFRFPILRQSGDYLGVHTRETIQIMFEDTAIALGDRSHSRFGVQRLFVIGITRVW